MNSAVAARHKNLAFFFTAFIFSFVLIGASGFFLRSTLTTDSSGLDKATSMCLAGLRMGGFNPVGPNDDAYKVTVASSQDFELMFYRSSVLLARCPTFTITDYCVGPGCPISGLSFTIKMKKSNFLTRST